MKILKINIMRGPNYWSVTRHKLIVMILDLGEMEESSSVELLGFNDRLDALLPNLKNYPGSKDKKGNFLSKVEKGLSMGKIIEHMALEIQTQAGMDVSFGRVESYGEEGVYNLVFAYMEEAVGKYAARAAVRICHSLIVGESYDLAKDIREMRELRQEVRLGPSTSSIIEEAVSRGIPWIRLNKYSLCQLGYGENQKRIQATITSETSNLAVEIACNKEDTKNLLERAEMPVPKGEILSKKSNLREIVEYLGFPLVTKPLDGNHGKGITINITNWEQALKGFKAAKEFSRLVIVEKQITGEDYRLLVINNKLVAAAKRTPAHVIGDGKQSIRDLIEEVNKDPGRGYGHEKNLTQITVNDLTKSIILAEGYTLDSVLKENEKLVLKDTANLSTGGTSEDVTDIVHPSNKFMAERISRIIGLDICGIDVMTADISNSLSETGGAVIEVNAGPGFRMHLSPTAGLPRNVAAHVIDKLFPSGSNGSIPIVAVTGTNGKTTTTRLIAHIAKQQGYKVGYTTSDGVYIQNRLLMEGDCTGPVSTAFVLKDPTVNFAVLECARGGLLRSGLGFGQCDTGIVTNVSEDHLGLKGIHTLEQLAKVKGIIPESVKQDGFAILNADDDLVYEMRKNVVSKVALFSMDENNPRIKEMQEEGGLTAVYENGYITICKGAWKLRVVKAVKVPLTFGGKAGFMIQNILPAVLTAYIHHMDLEDIKAALETFTPSPGQTPGRMNLFQFKDFQLLMDYAHNPSGMKALKAFTDKVDASVKVGIITGVGDRKKEDTVEIGRISAEMFDEIIIRQDEHLRGRTVEEIIGFLEEGIYSHDPQKKVTIIKDEKEAVTYAVQNAERGALIVICTEMIIVVTELIQELQVDGSDKQWDVEGKGISEASVNE
ncbi:cyanophycin synthetase [Gillisia limnaea]|uniref:Cyanophycin synthetase n=1 Tax=Gillisia limnaea (strain DSM 15749 / LMG 21470 / R-8282) TaxID=865937 RepID=H2BY52_GILLR|nr:cyanophycin synthetase [Gillisia limnaea]EHQ03258.1 cyanophycin synthetase [Gillisia limnaea DSM 15749]